MKKKDLLTLLLLGYGWTATAQTAQKFRPMEDVNHVVDLTLDSLELANTARPVPGSSRRGDNPVLFLVGNSTMRTGTKGNGDNGQWGWGFFAHEYFDEAKISVENHALGGTSSRTFYRRLWPDVKKGIRKGDYVIIELGHNDNGPFDSGRARASIRGISPADSLEVTNGKPSTAMANTCAASCANARHWGRIPSCFHSPRATLGTRTGRGTWGASTTPSDSGHGRWPRSRTSPSST